MINLKVRGIIFSDVLISVLTSLKGYELMQERGTALVGVEGYWILKECLPKISKTLGPV